MGLLGIIICSNTTPVKILPIASRFNGVKVNKLFSLIIITGLNRGE